MVSVVCNADKLCKHTHSVHNIHMLYDFSHDLELSYVPTYCVCVCVWGDDDDDKSASKFVEAKLLLS